MLTSVNRDVIAAQIAHYDAAAAKSAECYQARDEDMHRAAANALRQLLRTLESQAEPAPVEPVVVRITPWSARTVETEGGGLSEESYGGWGAVLDLGEREVAADYSLESNIFIERAPLSVDASDWLGEVARGFWDAIPEQVPVTVVMQFELDEDVTWFRFQRNGDEYLPVVEG